MEQIAARCLFERKMALRKAIIVLVIINHLYGTLMNLWDFVQKHNGEFSQLTSFLEVFPLIL